MPDLVSNINSAISIFSIVKKVWEWNNEYVILEQHNIRQNNNFDKFALDCLLHNLPAKNLYHSLGFREIVSTDNLYDIVYWPKSGEFKVEELRINFNRQIYDVPHQEMKLLVKDLSLSGEELYRAILNYFGYEILTEKARTYLEYIEKITR